MSLPPLSAKPHHFPDCCVSLSTQLVDHLSTLISTRSPILSIGCGTGLLEAYLQQQRSDWTIEGVEVDASSQLAIARVNRYLPSASVHIVPGSWALCERAQNAPVWLFVYPRQAKLVHAYVEKYVADNVQMIVWLGARADWADFGPCFEPLERLGWSVERVLGETCGLVEYEMMAVIMRDCVTAEKSK